MSGPVSRLPANQQWTARGKWPIVGERKPRPDESPWRIEIGGLVRSGASWSLADLLALPQVERTIDLHCVTRWSLKDARFSGIRLAELLATCGVEDSARFVSFVARSERAHSTSLSLADVARTDPLVALKYNGDPIPLEHGGPVRVIVPGKYLYKSLKWLERIEVLAEDRLGYWEAEAGYHNHADPWLEERYIAGNFDRRLALQWIAARDIADRELLGLQAGGMDLAGLAASRARLRNADFRRADLRGAKFDQANLSNAHFEGADLRGASFHDADAEGADFRGTDLRGVDFTGCYLTAATFCDSPDAGGQSAGDATIDHTTRFSPESLEVLTRFQAEFVANRISGSAAAGGADPVDRP